ncbi:M15 family metallopeptidase [Paraburkholderia sp. RL18-101-BIB-B]|uniref:M15 family metallopeptidase n=1 Tax=Paraburkholderia sp. RL18-101-BIB-B TaxID=3031634 RepID=UPI0038BC89BE
MPESTFVHPLFGEVRFETRHDYWKRGDHITFISGFDSADVTPIFIPQLKDIPGSNGGKLRFHKRGQQQLLDVFHEIEAQALLRFVKTCAGTLNRRLRKPTSGALSKLPSNHAFGIAIDMNEDDPGFGDSVAPVAPIFQKYGFMWGKSFNDPMHFEIEKFREA